MADTPSARTTADPIYRESSAAQVLLDRADAIAANIYSTRRDLEARLEGVAFGAPPSEVSKPKERSVPDFFDRLHGALDVIEANLQALQSLNDRVAL